MNGSEETATAFTVSITREQSFSLQIQENVARIRHIATVEQLQLEYTDTRTHTQSALPYSSCGYASRHNCV